MPGYGIQGYWDLEDVVYWGVTLGEAVMSRYRMTVEDGCGAAVEVTAVPADLRAECRWVGQGWHACRPCMQRMEQEARFFFTRATAI